MGRGGGKMGWGLDGEQRGWVWDMPRRQLVSPNRHAASPPNTQPGCSNPSPQTHWQRACITVLSHGWGQGLVVVVICPKLHDQGGPQAQGTEQLGGARQKKVETAKKQKPAQARPVNGLGTVGSAVGTEPGHIVLGSTYRLLPAFPQCFLISQCILEEDTHTLTRTLGAQQC
jgi:hypothetical protein